MNHKQLEKVLKNYTDLRVLDLSWNHIEDSGCSQLINLLPDTVEDLSLEGNQVATLSCLSLGDYLISSLCLTTM